MPYLLNLIYLLGLCVFSPWLLYRALTTGRYRRGIRDKILGIVPHPARRHGETASKKVWFHGVSVGEIHLLRPLVARFRERHPDWDCVISTTTDTGYDEAQKRFPDLPIFYWPLDFSWAVRRALAAVQPNLVVVAEVELWPNFLRAAKEQGTPVAVINARMSPRSFERWRWLKHSFSFFLSPFSSIDLWAVQTEEYAGCFRALGVPGARLQVTGSIKYDGVELNRENPRTQEMRRLLAVGPEDLVWIAGSTQAPEEDIVLDIYRREKALEPRLRLILVPRQKDRFDEVADLLRSSGLPFVRRIALVEPIADRSAIVLVDTIGDLSAVWGLADLAFVGGSLDGKRGGQNMIEPAAYGAAVIFGPHIWNFRATVTRLLGAKAAVQIADAAALEETVRRLRADPAERARLGSAARRLVLEQQGATERTLDALEGLLARVARRTSRIERAA